MGEVVTDRAHVQTFHAFTVAPCTQCGAAGCWRCNGGAVTHHYGPYTFPIEGWRVVAVPEDGPYYPYTPKDRFAVFGVLAENTRPEYPPTYSDLRRRPQLIVVSGKLDPVWGLRVWLRSPTGWWLQTTHVQNTLLDDPAFAAIVETRCTPRA